MSFEDFEKLVSESEIAAENARRQRKCLTKECQNRLADNIKNALFRSVGLSGKKIDICFRSQDSNVLSECEQLIKPATYADAIELKQGLSEYFPERMIYISEKDLVCTINEKNKGPKYKPDGCYDLYMQMPEVKK